MNIKPDFSHKIIIHAVGPIQLKLLFLIYSNLNIFHYQNFKINNDNGQFFKNLKRAFKLMDERELEYFTDNIKLEAIYIPQLGTFNQDKVTTYLKTKIQRTLNENNTKYLKDHSVFGRITENRNINFFEYTLINMSQFLKIYGKYLFESKEHRDIFVDNNSHLEECNVFKFIKDINYG